MYERERENEREASWGRNIWGKYLRKITNFTLDQHFFTLLLLFYLLDLLLLSAFYGLFISPYALHLLVAMHGAYTPAPFSAPSLSLSCALSASLTWQVGNFPLLCRSRAPSFPLHPSSMPLHHHSFFCKTLHCWAINYHSPDLLFL